MGSKNFFSKEFRGGTVKGKAREIISWSSLMKHIITFTANKRLI